MARSEGSSGGASRLPKPEATTITFTPAKRQSPRRKKTLIAITACLNVLLWASISALICTAYLIAADPGDVTDLPSEILIITSSLASIAYIILHSAVAWRQTSWPEVRLQRSPLSKTSYFAIRLSVTLAVLWLCTSGWNMIIAARQPICLAKSSYLAGWEAGSTCVVGRIAIAMSLFALIASCVLFAILAIVRRPFEATLFKHTYARPTVYPATPKPSSRPSRSVSFSSKSSHSQSSVHTMSLSHRSNADVDTLDLEAASPLSSESQSPVRSIGSIGLGIFTSQSQPPPPLPPLLIPKRPTSLTPSRATSLIGVPPPMYHPSTSYQHLPVSRPSSIASFHLARNSSAPHLTDPNSILLPIPPTIADSAWRAIHPPMHTASRSFSHLPLPISHPPNFCYANRYSRSVVSLSRPQRLSSAPVPGVARSNRSSRSGQSGSISGSGTGSDDSAYLSVRESRRSSAPDVDPFRPTLNPTPILLPPSVGRRSKAWRPRLEGQEEGFEGLPVKISVTVMQDTGKEENEVGETSVLGFEEEMNLRLGLELVVRKTRSMSPLRSSDRLGKLDRAATVRVGKGGERAGGGMLDEKGKVGTM
ncbi:hypothetical protein BU16DRAFT_107074 [Lophium mytilinum]|uniref:Uncharacterized protein n=1 Tax=Lophium mytilinum TaxID=390894 RepID=A0A6A6QJN4_9PEZI|nr:hypothetical protein BU16DRAFT_107074 [Lophium mytilinum]